MKSNSAEFPILSVFWSELGVARFRRTHGSGEHTHNVVTSTVGFLIWFEIAFCCNFSMDSGHFYMQNRIVYARSIGFSIGEHADGHFDWTLRGDFVSIRLNNTKVQPISQYTHIFVASFYVISFSYFQTHFFHSQFHRQYRVTVTIIWLFALTINMPWLFVFHLEPLEAGSDRKVCSFCARGTPYYYGIMIVMVCTFCPHVDLHRTVAIEVVGTSVLSAGQFDFMLFGSTVCDIVLLHYHMEECGESKHSRRIFGLSEHTRCNQQESAQGDQNGVRCYYNICNVMASIVQHILHCQVPGRNTIWWTRCGKGNWIIATQLLEPICFEFHKFSSLCTLLLGYRTFSRRLNLQSGKSYFSSYRWLSGKWFYHFIIYSRINADKRPIETKFIHVYVGWEHQIQASIPYCIVTWIKSFASVSR